MVVLWPATVIWHWMIEDFMTRLLGLWPIRKGIDYLSPLAPGLNPLGSSGLGVGLGQVCSPEADAASQIANHPGITG